MKLLFYLGAILVLFCGPAILFQLGWVIDYGGAPGYQKFHPSLYVFTITAAYAIIVSWRNISFFFWEFFLIYLLILIICLMVFSGQNSGFTLLVNNLLIPVFLSISIRFFINRDNTVKSVVTRLVIAFYIVNCFIAILERLISFNFFKYLDGQGEFLVFWPWDAMSFRSTALHNHPLSNALLVSIVMFYILYSELSNRKKNILYVFGIVALLCFNTRFAIVMSVMPYGFYMLNHVFIKKTASVGSKIYLIFALVGMVVTILVLIVNYDFGGRMFKYGIYDDDSAGARLKIFEVFEYYSLENFLIGGSTEDLDKSAAKIGLFHIENYWIIYLFRIGFIFTFLITIGYSFIFRHFTRMHDRSIYVVILLFLLLSSSNNSLASNVPGIMVFILGAVAFAKS